MKEARTTLAVLSAPLVVFTLSLGLALSAAVVTPSCESVGSLTEPVGSVHAENVRGVVADVCDRLRAYLALDERVDEARRSELLTAAERLEAAVEEERISSTLLGYLAEPVMEAHDAYVLADASLSDNGRAVRLESSTRIRAIAGVRYL